MSIDVPSKLIFYFELRFDWFKISLCHFELVTDALMPHFCTFLHLYSLFCLVFPFIHVLSCQVLDKFELKLKFLHCGPCNDQLWWNLVDVIELIWVFYCLICESVHKEDARELLIQLEPHEFCQWSCEWNLVFFCEVKLGDDWDELRARLVSKLRCLGSQRHSPVIHHRCRVFERISLQHKDNGTHFVVINHILSPLTPAWRALHDRWAQWKKQEVKVYFLYFCYVDRGHRSIWPVEEDEVVLVGV